MVKTWKHKMSESPKRPLLEEEEKKPISELTLREAEAYLEDSMCLPETVIGELIIETAEFTFSLQCIYHLPKH